MRLGVVIVCALALAACKGPVALGGDSSETDGSSSEADGSSSETDGGEALACMDEGGLIPGVLRLEAAPARAWLIDYGTERELPLQGGDEAAWMDGSAAGDYIAVARTDGELDHDSIVHMFSRSSGERLRVEPLRGFGVQSVMMGDDGWLSGNVTNDMPGVVVGFLMSETELIFLPDHAPAAPPAFGHVAAYDRSADDRDDSQGWLDLDDLSWQPLMPPPGESPYYPTTIAEDHHTFEYLVFLDGAFTFVRARPGEADTIPLPFVVAEEWVAIVAQNDRYRVVRRVMSWIDPPVIDHVRIDVESGEVVLINPEPPPGWSFYDCEKRETAIDGDGRLYFELRSDSNARAWVYDLDTEAWTAVGRPLSHVIDISVRAWSRDFVRVSGSVYADFCNDGYWTQPPMNALLGDSAQLVRQEPPLTMVLSPYTHTRIDGQQRCVAIREDDGWQVRPLDESDTVLDLGPGVGDLLWID